MLMDWRRSGVLAVTGCIFLISIFRLQGSEKHRDLLSIRSGTGYASHWDGSRLRYEVARLASEQRLQRKAEQNILLAVSNLEHGARGAAQSSSDEETNARPNINRVQHVMPAESTRVRQKKPKMMVTAKLPMTSKQFETVRANFVAALAGAAGARWSQVHITSLLYASSGGKTSSDKDTVTVEAQITGKPTMITADAVDRWLREQGLPAVASFQARFISAVSPAPATTSDTMPPRAAVVGGGARAMARRQERLCSSQDSDEGCGHNRIGNVQSTPAGIHSLAVEAGSPAGPLAHHALATDVSLGGRSTQSNAAIVVPTAADARFRDSSLAAGPTHTPAAAIRATATSTVVMPNPAAAAGASTAATVPRGPDMSLKAGDDGSRAARPTAGAAGGAGVGAGGEGEGAGGEEEGTVVGADEEMFVVTVPGGLSPGQHFGAEVPGTGLMDVVVPAGAGPGQRVAIRVPSSTATTARPPASGGASAMRTGGDDHRRQSSLSAAAVDPLTRHSRLLSAAEGGGRLLSSVAERESIAGQSLARLYPPPAAHVAARETAVSSHAAAPASIASAASGAAASFTSVVAAAAAATVEAAERRGHGPSALAREQGLSAAAAAAAADWKISGAVVRNHVAAARRTPGDGGGGDVRGGGGGSKVGATGQGAALTPSGVDWRAELHRAAAERAAAAAAARRRREDERRGGVRGAVKAARTAAAAAQVLVYRPPPPLWPPAHAAAA